MDLTKRFETEKVMMEQIEILEKEYDTLLTNLYEGLEDKDTIKDLKKLDRTIDHRRRMYELHVAETNKLIYG